MKFHPMFSPGSLVLTKIKGFPEWPSRVIDYEQLPEKIQKIRPASAAGRRRRRGDSDTRSVCVKFYGDDEYFWCSEKDLKPLDDDAVTSYLVKKGELPDVDGNFRVKRASKVSSLTNAYLCANNKDVSAEDFALYGSYGKVGEDDEDYEEDEDEYEEEEDDEEEEEDEDEEGEESDDESDEEEASYGKSGRKRSNGTAQSRKRRKVDESDDESDDESGDSDWGLDSGVEDAGLDIEPVKAHDLVEDVKKSTKFLSDIRVQIQKVAFPADGEVDYSSANKQLEPAVNKLAGQKTVSRAVLKSTNIAKVLVLILKKPEFAKLKVARKIATILKNWLDLKVAPDEHWADDYESEPEEEQEPEEHKQESVPPEVKPEPVNGS
ncbi:hypothetical protein OGAPHI_005774 [Ogataea philodendri]|uniref:PWWP domain-containing protein n=2 Tax=Saccharomycotina TaxID=147537 RepID=A0A9P8NZN6_9ASCO|nr:uncharacterized protein OGAPHI_005774 [Ogataea philodendri]KAH3662522.1 hypothetical protein OGAPHI_005774 [Ogataea philodendri]